MALLVGRHVNKIDKKGRVSVPKPFRDAFQKQTFAGIYVFPSFKMPAIEACGEDLMRRLSDSLDSLALFSDEQDDLAAVILENAHPLPFDPEGRVIVPKDLLDYAGIAEQALFVGRGGRMQIWHPRRYDEHRIAAFGRARARGATLRLRPATPDAEGPS